MATEIRTDTEILKDIVHELWLGIPENWWTSKLHNLVREYDNKQIVSHYDRNRT